MKNAAEVADFLGRVPIARAVGVGETAVSNAVSQGKFPARWYLAVRNLLNERGEECPDHLFRFERSRKAS